MAGETSLLGGGARPGRGKTNTDSFHDHLFISQQSSLLCLPHCSLVIQLVPIPCAPRKAAQQSGTDPHVEALSVAGQLQPGLCHNMFGFPSGIIKPEVRVFRYKEAAHHGSTPPIVTYPSAFGSLFLHVLKDLDSFTSWAANQVTNQASGGSHEKSQLENSAKVANSASTDLFPSP